MKTVFGIMYVGLVIVLLIGCNGQKKKPIKYSLIPAKYGGIVIPDSNNQKYTEFVLKTVEAATANNPSTEKHYKIVEAAEEIADKLYGVPALDLCEVYSENLVIGLKR